jgi:hypothetical protein
MAVGGTGVARIPGGKGTKAAGGSPRNKELRSMLRQYAAQYDRDFQMQRPKCVYTSRQDGAIGSLDSSLPFRFLVVI